MHCDVLIFGGGVAGLWLLDELRREGVSALLLEADALGRGQTIAAQGIIHGGLKYTLQGMMTDSARQIREMPVLWRDCLAGVREPDLSATTLRAPHCYLWRTDSLSSRLGMLGARVGLRVAPTQLSVDERPSLLAGCPGAVARLDEPVISPASLLRNLADRNVGRILKIDVPDGVEFELSGPGHVAAVHLRIGTGSSMQELTLRPRSVVFAAGAGNARLRQQAGLRDELMQRRPLHMVLVRGALPALHGHCVDGAKTRVTITSEADRAGRTVWQLGGQVAEDGVSREPLALIAHAGHELQAVIPGIELGKTEWATYRVDRAERVMQNGSRPDSAQVVSEGNCISAWPTKLALAPQLAANVMRELKRAGIDANRDANAALKDLPHWPRPSVALPPWEQARAWHAWKDGADRHGQRAA